jgi:EAL domain-containing protein (putative c-di-GMP-specific phosphodiesterase class I)
MNESKNALTIVKAIVQLAKSLGLGLIAEGIETEDQILTLTVLGCEHGQGFHLGRPSPGMALTAEPRARDGDTEADSGLVLPHAQQRARRRLRGRGPSEL